MTPARPLPMKTIGILGGMANQTYEYQRLINKAANERLGGWDIAETVVVGINYGNFEDFARNQLWDKAGDYLSAKAQAAERAGAEVLVCASHTMHRVAERIVEKIHIPFLHVVDPAGQALRAAGISKAALLGTKPVMSAEHLHRDYLNRHGVEIVVPSDPEQRRIDQIIFDDLARGAFDSPTLKSIFIDICENLHQQGARGVVFCSPEIGLVIGQRDMPRFPVFDAAILHVEAAVMEALK
jgi:aspartate racemase